MVRALDLQQKEAVVRLMAIPLLGNNTWKVVHPYALKSPSTIIWYGPNGAETL